MAEVVINYDWLTGPKAMEVGDNGIDLIIFFEKEVLHVYDDGLEQMLPTSALDDAAYRRVRDTISASNFRPVSRVDSNCHHVITRQSCGNTSFAVGMAFALYHIARIILHRAWQQMRGAAALGIVASMSQDDGSRDGLNFQLVQNAMNATRFLIDANYAVSMFIQSALPQPTSFGFQYVRIDSLPQAFSRKVSSLFITGLRTVFANFAFWITEKHAACLTLMWYFTKSHWSFTSYVKAMWLELSDRTNGLATFPILPQFREACLCK